MCPDPSPNEPAANDPETENANSGRDVFLAILLLVVLVGVLSAVAWNGAYVILWFPGAAVLFALACLVRIVRRPSPKTHVAAKIVTLCFVAAGCIAVDILLWKGLVRSRDSARRAACAGNLKQSGMILRMYAEEHEGATPPLDSEPGRLMYARTLYPEFLADPAALECPTVHPIRSLSQRAEVRADDFDDESYVYLSHILTTEAEGLAYAEAYRQRVAEGRRLDEDFEVPEGQGNEGESVLRRVDFDDIPAGPGSDGRKPVQSAVPVVVERVGHHHKPDGGNVLYLDGHVEYVRLGAKFPMTEGFMRAIESMDAVAKAHREP